MAKDLTPANRQQSLESARNAVHFLRLYIESQIVDERIRAEINCLIAEFKRLDENARRPRAGRPRLKNVSPKTLAQRRWRAKQKPK